MIMKLVAAALVSILATPALSFALECGHTIGKGQALILEEDLDCGTYASSTSILIENGGFLDLNGHTLTGNIECSRSCTVTSRAVEPGVVRCGIYGNGIFMAGRGRLSRITIDGCFGAAMSHRRIDASDVTITNCTRGIEARTVVVRDSSASNNIFGFMGWALLRATNVQVTDNANGLRGARVRAQGITASGNTQGGISGHRVVVRDSTLLGNTVDIAALRSVRVISTDCETSRRLDKSGNLTEQSLGVCSLDP